jgi:hypothetical protein
MARDLGEDALRDQWNHGITELRINGTTELRKHGITDGEWFTATYGSRFMVKDE